MQRASAHRLAHTPEPTIPSVAASSTREPMVLGDGHIDHAMASKALDRLEVDSAGLDAMDRRLLTTIVEHYKGGPVGIDTLAAALSEPRDTLEDVYQPYLLQQGFLARTARGRVVTDRAYEHLGIELPLRQQQRLF